MMDALQIQALGNTLQENVSKVISGKEEVIRRVLTALFAGGHLLLEDMPGTGKTTLAKALAQSIAADCTRVQFTPDLLPSDLTGINFFSQKESDFVLKKGPVFTNILLADEINRTTPRTQSSLLECMEEGQVSIDSQTYRLDQPFLVIATQNPIETQGTFPLPEAQLDRFFMRLSMGYPGKEAEMEMLGRMGKQSPLKTLEPVASKEDVLAAQAGVREILVSDAVKGYLVDLVAATRTHSQIRLGVSPRGALALMRASQANAAMNGRSYVTPDDVKELAPYVLAHRILCRSHSALHSGNPAEEALQELLGSVAVPTEI